MIWGTTFFWKHPYKHFGLTTYLKVIASGSGFMNSHHSPCLLQLFSSILDALLPSCNISTTVHILPSEIETYLPFAPSPEDVPVEQLHALLQRCGSTAGRSWKSPQAEHGTYLHRIERDRTACPDTNIKSPTSPSFAMA